MVKKFLLLAFAASAAFSSAFAAESVCALELSDNPLPTFSGFQIKPEIIRATCTTNGVTSDVNYDKNSVSYGPNVNAGTGTVTVKMTAGGEITQEFEIGQKTVFITVADTTKEKGTDDPEFRWTLSEPKNMFKDTVDNLKLELAKEIKLSRTPGESIVNAKGETVRYSIKLASGIDDVLEKKFPNYMISVTPGALTITKTKVTVAAVGAGKTYGEEDPEKLEYTINGKIDPSEYSKLGLISVKREPGEDVGEYNISVSVENMKTADFDVAVVGSVFGITRAPASVVVDDVSKNYGDATPKFTYKVEGLIGDDELKDVELSCAKCSKEGLENVGEYVIAVSVPEKSNPNYKLELTNGTFSVTPRKATVTVDNAEKTYGAKDPKYTFTAEGLVDGQSLKGGTAAREEGEDVGSYKVDLSFDEDANPNYKITTKPGSLKITPKAVTLTANNISKKFGEKDPELTYKVDALVGEDKLEGVVLSREKGENAGKYAITAKVDAKANPNYEVTAEGGEFTIVANDDKIVVSITGHIDTVAYDGKDHVLKGFDIASNSEAFSVDFVEYTGDSSVTGKDAGAYPMGLSADNFKNTSVNYPNVTFKVTDGSLVVKPRSVIVTAKSDSITYGDATPTEFVWTADSLLKGDSLDNIHVTIKKTGLLAAGEYELVFDKKNPTNKNYVVSDYVAGTLKVNKKLVTVTIADTSKVYGSPDPATYRYEATGLLDGDSLPGLVIAREAGEDVLVATDSLNDAYYRISASFAPDAAVNSNYSIKVNQGHFKVTPYKNPIKVIIIGNRIVEKYTGDTITVPKSFDVILFNDVDEENPLPAEYTYLPKYVAYTGNPTVSGVNRYLYPMNFKVEDFKNISPNFETVNFVLSVDGTLVINDTGPTSIAALKNVKTFGVTSMGRSIQISGSKVGDKYAVLDLRGKTVSKGVVSAANFEISVPTAGVYMVRVGSTAKRIHVK